MMQTQANRNSRRRPERRKRRNRRYRQVTNFLKVVICVAVALIAAGLIWRAAKPYVRRAEWRQEKEEVTAAAGSSSEPLTFPPQYEDGSGQAGVSILSGDMAPAFDTPGWQHDANGWWYACDYNTCYVSGWAELDGRRYHFDDQGYMSCGGWVPIGGKGCFFDGNGIYDASRNADNMVALTFDDGPSEYTDRLLNILEENNAQASFMMLGTAAERYGEGTISRMIDLGCTIGNHSYDHADLKLLSTAEVREEFSRADEAVSAVTGGQKPTVVRFPYGSYTKELAAISQRPCFFWSLDTEDWNQKTPQDIVSKVVGHVSGGSIVLMHDTHQITVDACETIIPELIDEGFELVSLETMAAARGFELEPGVTYFGFTDREIANKVASDEESE